MDLVGSGSPIVVWDVTLGATTGAAAVDGSSIWVASKYIGQTCALDQWLTAPIGQCGGTRTALANWDTRISKLTP